MKKILKIFFIAFVLFGLFVMPLNSALAMKWNRQLIMIYIPEDETYASMMKKAVGEWQKYTKKMSIMITQQQRDLPLVEVETNFSVVADCNCKNSYNVTFSSSSNYFRHAKIEITANESAEIFEDPEKKQENDEELYAIMLKSVGKMLGVPESTDERSVMYPEYKKGQSILPSDVDNFMTVYGWSKKTKTN